MLFQVPDRREIRKTIKRLRSQISRGKLVPSQGRPLIPFEYGSIDAIDEEYQTLYQKGALALHPVGEFNLNALSRSFLKPIVEEYVRFHPDLRDSVLEDHLRKIYNGFKRSVLIHRAQTRDDGRPYVFHTSATAYYAAMRGMELDDIIACFLHDAVEDKKVTLENLRKEFGPSVANIVRLESKPKIRMNAVVPPCSLPEACVPDPLNPKGPKLRLRIVYPDSLDYHTDETRLEKLLRRTHRALLNRLHLEQLVPRRRSIQIPLRALRARGGRFSDEWSALNARFHDVIHNLQTIVGKLRNRPLEEWGNILDNTVRQRMEYLDLFFLFGHHLFDSLPKFVRDKYWNIKAEAESRERLVPEKPTGLVFHRSSPRTEFDAESLRAHPRGNVPVVYYVQKGHGYSPTEREVLLSHDLIAEGARFRDLDSITEALRCELVRQLTPSHTSLSALPPSLQKRIRDGGFVQRVRSLLPPGDPQFIALNVNLAHLPASEREHALDRAISHVVAVHAWDPLEKIEEGVRQKIAMRSRGGLFWTPHTLEQGSYSVYLPYKHFGNFKGAAEQLARILSVAKQSGLIRGYEFMDPRHRRPSFHHFSVALDPSLSQERVQQIMDALSSSLKKPMKDHKRKA